MRTRAQGCGWLVCGFVIRFCLAVVETAAYFTRVFPSRWTRSEAVAIFLSSNNDSYGHQAGDDCLRRFAAALRESFGPDDHLARYGGDEFLAVTRAGEPQAMIERVREILRGQRGGPAIRVAAGVARMNASSNPEDALHAAAAAMYAAKQSRSS